MQAGSCISVKCARLISFAHAHNEKYCPVTIDRVFRYEGVRIVDCTNYRRIHLTFMPFRVMYKMYANHRKQQEMTENLLKTVPESAII